MERRPISRTLRFFGRDEALLNRLIALGFEVVDNIDQCDYVVIYSEALSETVLSKFIPYSNGSDRSELDDLADIELYCQACKRGKRILYLRAWHILRAALNHERVFRNSRVLPYALPLIKESISVNRDKSMKISVSSNALNQHNRFLCTPSDAGESVLGLMYLHGVSFDVDMTNLLPGSYASEYFVDIMETHFHKGSEEALKVARFGETLHKGESGIPVKIEYLKSPDKVFYKEDEEVFYDPSSFTVEAVENALTSLFVSKTPKAKNTPPADDLFLDLDDIKPLSPDDIKPLSPDDKIVLKNAKTSNNQ